MGPARGLYTGKFCAIQMMLLAQHGLPPAMSGTVIKEYRKKMADLGYVVLTLAVFGVLLLILKGIERFER
jgi:hypothetical protein